MCIGEGYIARNSAGKEKPSLVLLASVVKETPQMTQVFGTAHDCLPELAGETPLLTTGYTSDIGVKNTNIQ